MDYLNRWYNQQLVSLKQLTAKDFVLGGAIGSNIVVKPDALVFFYVKACNQCQTFLLTLNRFVKIYGTTIDIYTVDIDNNKDLIPRSKDFMYSVGGRYPTIILFKNGQPCSSYNSNLNSVDSLHDFISQSTCALKKK
jgi:thioredoxin-like negative regulator of GroEL